LEFKQKTRKREFFCYSVNIKSLDFLVQLPDQWNGNNNMLEIFFRVEVFEKL